MISQRELAKTLGVDSKTITNVKRRLKIDSKTLTKNDIKKISEECKKIKETTDFAKEVSKEPKNEKPKKYKVRDISKTEGSSVADMLQDCKEQYVENQKLILKIQDEINQIGRLCVGNNNGTLSPIPQLGALEKYQKININLRTQIVQLEESLGKAPNDEEDDPFE